MEIKCEFEENKWHLRKPQTVYTCTVTSCNITCRDSQIIAFKGDHGESMNNSKVRGLSFGNTTVHYIPRNLTTIFPMLVYLQIDNCGLKEVLRKDMFELENLEALWIENNEITSLPVDLFKNMANLKEVCINRNEIERFNTRIIEPIKSSIKYFRIYGNPGLSECFSKNPDTIENFIERLKNSEFNQMKLKRLENLFTTSKHSDFTIEVRDKKYEVHKCILASMSSVFDKMFSAYPELTSKRYENIRNFSDDAIEEFLSCFYTSGSPRKKSVHELLELAVEFDVSDLKLQCEDVLVKTITQENALKLYNLASRHSLPYLKRKAFEAVQESHPEIADFLFEKPELVNGTIEAKHEHQAKKIKLEIED